MAEGDNPETGPLSMEDAVSQYVDLIETTTEEEPEAAPDAEEEQAEVEAEAETSDDEDPQDTAEETQVLTADEYGDVLIAVGDEQLTLSDVIQGHLRQSDYTRKTQTLSEERKALEAEFAQKEEALAAREQSLLTQFADLQVEEPDWKAMAEEDPLGWQLKKMDWDKSQNARQAAMQKAQEAQEAQVQQFSAMTAQKAMEVHPEWADREAFDKGSAERRKAALSYGFTSEEYNSAIDFRIAAVLEDAVRYRALKAKAAPVEKKLVKAPKVLKPGSATTKQDVKAEEKAAKSKKLSRPHTIHEALNIHGF